MHQVAHGGMWSGEPIIEELQFHPRLVAPTRVNKKSLPFNLVGYDCLRTCMTCEAGWNVFSRLGIPVSSTRN